MKQESINLIPEEYTEAVGSELLANQFKDKKMNTVSNITFLTLAIGSLGGVVASLQAHDYIVAGGMLVFGLIMVWVYEKTPPTTPTIQ